MNGEALRIASEVRSTGIRVEVGDEGFRLKRSFEMAAREGMFFVAIVGETEAASKTVALKNLYTGEQVSIPQSELSQQIRAKWYDGTSVQQPPK